MILASQSPRRIDILKLAGIDATVMPQDIDETPHAGELPCDLVCRLAREKARACSHAAPPQEIIVAADTIVWFANEELGKPADAEDAHRMLRELSGRTHHVSTGVCIMRNNEERCFVETTDVTFFELSDEEIEAYVASGDPLDKAGAYGYQSLGCTLVERIEGDYYNVVGLPIGRLLRELAAMNVDD